MVKRNEALTHLAKDISIAVGLIMIGRGIWYVVDGLDRYFFGGSHGWTGVLSVVIGLIILYVPDKDFKELEKL